MSGLKSAYFHTIGSLKSGKNDVLKKVSHEKAGE